MMETLNKKISVAKFMGHEVTEKFGQLYISTPFNLKTDRNLRTDFPAFCMRYDTSWDWLVPVIKRINLLGVDLTSWRMITNSLDYPIDRVFEQVSQFIEWYNENK